MRQTSHPAISPPKEPRRQLEHGYRPPRIKAVVAAAWEGLKDFLKEYYEALAELQAGGPPVFPAGTWWQVQHGGCVAAAAG